MSNDDLKLQQEFEYYNNLKKKEIEIFKSENRFNEYINNQPDLSFEQMKEIIDLEEKFGLIKQFNINIGRNGEDLRKNTRLQLMIKSDLVLVGYLDIDYILNSFEKIKKLRNLGRSKAKIQRMFKILYYSDMWQMVTKYAYSRNYGNGCWRRGTPEMICDGNKNNRFYEITKFGFSYIDIDSEKDSVTEERLHKLLDFLRIRYNYHIEYAVISQNGHIGIFIKHNVDSHLEKRKEEKKLRELSNKINEFCNYIGLKSDKKNGFICDPQNKCTFSGKNFFCYKNIYKINNLKSRTEMISSGEVKNNKESLEELFNKFKYLFEFDKDNNDVEIKKEINIDSFLSEVKFECDKNEKRSFRNRFKNEKIMMDLDLVEECNDFDKDFNIFERYNYLMRIGNRLEAYNLLIENKILIPEGERHFMVETVGLSRFNDYTLKGIDFVSNISNIADELYFLMDQSGDEHSVEEIENELMLIYSKHKNESVSYIEQKRKESADKINFRKRKYVNKEELHKIFNRQRNNANKKNEEEFNNKCINISKDVYDSLVSFGYNNYEIKNLLEANLVKDKNKNKKLKHILNVLAEKIYNEKPDEFRKIRGGHYRENICFRSMWNRIKKDIIGLILKIIAKMLKKNINIDKLAEKYCNDEILTIEEIFILKHVYNIQIKNDLVLKSCRSG